MNILLKTLPFLLTLLHQRVVPTQLCFKIPTFEKLLRTKTAMNAHIQGISSSTFLTNEKLKSMLKILSTNKDRDSAEFVSTIESRRYSFYGVQWHPENNFEYFADEGDNPRNMINHSEDAVKVSVEMASVLVDAARKNRHIYTG